MSFPQQRLRRLRETQSLRRLMREVHLNKNDFIYPIFVREGISKKEEIKSMPGQYRWPLKDLDVILQKTEEAKVPAVMLFGIPASKDHNGSSAWDKNGIVQQAARQVKQTSSLAVFTDVCLCQYTSHGHCGILENKLINNDKSLEILDRVAVSHAEAGADFVAPSSMMDGTVGSIRKSLDSAGFSGTGILAYSAKFASRFYGPFRDAAHSVPKEEYGLSNRKTYQVSYFCPKQAMQEIRMDIEDAADIVMVKPAMPYLDIISMASRKFDIPIAAYQVSGEYAMLKSGVIDPVHAMYESLVAIKRAGADIIISYAALEVNVK